MTVFGVPLAELVQLAQAHFRLSAAAVLLALVIGIPLAIAAVRNEQLRGPLLATVNGIQTVPGLALLALFYPLLLLLGDATGLAIPALGFLPALLALGVYALLPIVRNTVTAFASIDGNLIQAADALGMSARQKLVLVEFPLGTPIILAGIRIAAVWTIGTATLATTIGQPCLGDLIFSGLQIQDWERVLAGCIAAALLALLVDFLLGLVESGLARRSKRRWLAGLAMISVLLLAAFVPPDDWTGRSEQAGMDRTVVIGAKGFSEQYILAELIAARLEKAGYRTKARYNLGSSVAYQAVRTGDIDVYVDYTGTLWANQLDRGEKLSAAEMLSVLRRELSERDGVTVLGALGFENAYAFAIRREQAGALGIASLEDLAREATSLDLATDLEFLSRPEWEGVRDAYGLTFASMRSYSPTFMYSAIEDGSADVISAFSSDGRISALGLTTLPDPRQALPNYDAVLLLSPNAGRDGQLVKSLSELVGSIPIDTMREANWMVDRSQDKRTAREAASWLAQEISASR